MNGISKCTSSLEVGAIEDLNDVPKCMSNMDMNAIKQP